MRPSLLFCLACALAASAASAQTPLRVHVPVSDSLAAYAEHAYTLRLRPGDTAAGDADGPDVDMVVRVLRPDGTELESFDTGRRGPEPFAFEAPVAGVYQIVAAPYGGEAGRYTLTLHRAGRAAADTLGRIAEALSVFGGAGQPAAVLAVLRNGRIAETVAQGVDERGRAVGLRMRVDAGDIGASMTAARTLARAGRLDLDAPVQRYLPDLPAPTGPITVRDVLGYTTGYLSVRTVEWLRGWTPGDTLAQDAAARTLAFQATLPNRPRTRGDGGRTDDMVLALVLEAATGQPFARLMETLLFRPLGMTDTAVKTLPGETMRGVATGHTAGAGTRISGETADGTYGWGNVYSTPADLARWIAALTGGRPRVVVPWVPAENRNYWQYITTDGLLAMPVIGGQRVTATGITDGYVVRVAYDPQTRAGYVFAATSSRRGDPLPDVLDAYVFRDRQPGVPIPTAPPSLPPDPVPPGEVDALRAALPGRYVNEALGAAFELTFSSQYGGSIMTLTDAAGRPYTFRFDGRTELYSGDGLGWIAVDAALPDGRPSFELLGDGRAGIRFVRAFE